MVCLWKINPKAAFRSLRWGRRRGLIPWRRLVVVKEQILIPVFVRFPAMQVAADQCFLPRPIRNIYTPSPERPIEACRYFRASYAWNILILNLYALSATLAEHSNSLSHHHTIHRYTSSHHRRFEVVLAVARPTVNINPRALKCVAPPRGHRITHCQQEFTDVKRNVILDHNGVSHA